MQKTKPNRKRKTGRIIFLIIIFLIVVAGIWIGSFIAGRLGNINIQEIDTSDLSINENLYNEIGGTLSKSEFEDVVTFVLFGTDSRDTGNMSAGRSDTIIVASINPKYRTIKLISIPRDTYVNVPGHGKTKINHAYAYGRREFSHKNN